MARAQNPNLFQIDKFVPQSLNSSHNLSLVGMPRTIIARPPGGASGKSRRRYAVRQKLQLLEECNRLQRTWKYSIRSAADEMGIPHCILVKWYQDRSRFEASLGNSKAICEGPEGQLHRIKEEILQWIFARREQGIVVTMSNVVYKATSILHHQEDDAAFKDNGFTARLSAVTRFLARYDFVYRTKTNEATKSPAEVYEEASAFMARARPSLRGPHRDPHFIWNMDQTPVYFSYHRSRTLAERGIRTVHVRKSTSDTRRATCALTCTAAGDFLRPMLIYKGKATGLIATREFQRHDPTSIYACQAAAWMDEVCMLRWIEEVLKPYLVVNPPPPGIVPVILLDAYRCHMMASVTDAIADLGIEIISIPGGCTGLCQPLDVGINKPFKTRIRALWEEWMIDEIDRTGMVYAPSREDISSWVAQVVWGMDKKPLMRNAWRKTGYDWFPEEAGGRDDDAMEDGDGDVDDDNYDDDADILEDVLGAGDESDDDD